MRRFWIVIAVILAVFITAACTNEDTDYREEEEDTQRQVQNRLQEQVPVPEIEGAAAREAIRRHLERWQDPNVVSYVTLFSRNGEPVGYYEASGKVASTCQMMTKPDQIVDNRSVDDTVVQAPALDGTYYTRGNCGVFFFTAQSDTYVELSPQWMYMVTDQPLPIPDVEPLSVGQAPPNS